MSAYQPQGYDPRRQQPATPSQWQGQQQQQYERQQVQPYAQPQYPQQRPDAQFGDPRSPQRPARRQLTAAESFWYVLGCIPMGAMYLCKVPCKKALADAGLAEMTAAEKFWYVLMCIAMGAGYFCKLPVAKALAERY